MESAAGPDPQSVFLNVPFDAGYESSFVTLVGTLISLGQSPRCVLEVRETGNGRLARIFELVRSCGISIHDLSRSGLPVRFNMPFELGMACTLALSGGPYEIVVLDRVRYRLDKTLSDYKGRDPLIYTNLDELVDAIADVFQLAAEPAPDVLKREARFLRKAARLIADSYGGTIFRRAAYRALVAASTRRAKAQGLIPPC